MTMHPSLARRPAGLSAMGRLIRHIRGLPRVWWIKLSEIGGYCHLGDVAPTLGSAVDHQTMNYNVNNQYGATDQA